MLEESTVIEQKCKRIRDSDRSPTNEELKDCLDAIINELNKTKTLHNANTFQEIIRTISFRFNHDRIFSTANLLHHQIFIIIRTYYLNLMHQWRTDQLLELCSGEVFCQIGMLFSDLCCNATDNDVEALKLLLIDEPLIDELCKCLKEISTEGKHLHDKYIEGINYCILAVNYLEKGRIEIQNIKIVSGLLDQIVNCVCSKYFIHMFNQIVHLKELDASQTFLLDTCTDFISWHDAGRYNDTHIAVRTALLHEFTSFLQKNSVLLPKVSKVAIQVIGQLSITVIGGNARDEDIFPSPIREDYCTMIDQLSSVLNTIVESKNTDELTIMLTRVLTQCLYSLTMTNDLRIYIKNKHIVPLLLKLTYIQDETIRFHVYRILAGILTEEDIKTLANPSQIANVFLKFFTNLIDDQSRKPRFYNLLRSLKSN